MTKEEIANYRQSLKCNFKEIDNCFADYIKDALINLSPKGIESYLNGASLICMIGRGYEPVITYLEEMPQIAAKLDETVLEIVSKAVWDISRTPNGRSILPFIQCLPEASRRLASIKQLNKFIEIIFDMMDKTTISIHGIHKTHASEGLLKLLEKVPILLNQLSLQGLKNWIDYGVVNYQNNPQRQQAYFSIKSADSKAIMQRERHGTLYIDNDNKLHLYLKSMWQAESYFIPYSYAFDEIRKPQPYYDKLGIRIPDVYEDFNNISGIDRYRITIAHIAGHKKWTTQVVADNYSPFQRMAIEHFEDSRIEYLILKQYPGLKKYLLKLHPKPIEYDCNPVNESCLRHRLTMLSRAILDENHNFKDKHIIDFRAKFHNIMAESDSSTKTMAELAILFVARTRLQSDQYANIYFKDTEVSYRDDNRHMWIYIEEGDEEDNLPDKKESENKEIELDSLPPKHYPEWDYNTNIFKPDWVSLYEAKHPAANASDIDGILNKHKDIVKLLKRILDKLKPQQYMRVRFQEDGSELDIDTAIKSLIDYRCGAIPDNRINVSYEHSGRNIAVMLLLDLSASLKEIPEGQTQSILELSQEAVSLLAWTIDQLGDKYAIAGFNSDTRHNVRYYHIKGYSEKFDDAVKSRLAAISSNYSTRMGAPIRHAAHYLSAQQADKKLLLILTDGEPSDIDVKDEKYLINDTKKAIDELSSSVISSFCISLDKKADNYIGDIFGNRYLVIDHINRLPEKLPQLFMSLTK